MFIDRRHLQRLGTPDSDSEVEQGDSDMTSLVRDRCKFDNDSDDDANDDPNYVNKDVLDPLDWRSILLRAQYSIGWQGHSGTAQQQAQIERNKQARIQAAPTQANAGQGSPQTLRQQVAQAQAAAAAGR